MKQPPIKTKELSGSTVQIADGQNWEIASITAYGENAQGGTTEAPVAITGVESVHVCGQNLLPRRKTGNVKNGITSTVNGDGSITLSGTATNRAVIYLVNTYHKIVLSKGTYTIGVRSVIPDGCSVSLGHYAGQHYVGLILRLTAGEASKSFQVSNITGVLEGYFEIKSGTTVNTTIYPMLNLGESPLPYEPYQGSVTQLPIPRSLRRVGDVKDKCVTRQDYESAEKLVVTYNVGFVELDGTEDWKDGQPTEGGEVYFTLNSLQSNSGKLIGFSSHFPVITILANNTNQGVGAWNTALYLRWKALFTDVDSLKAYLAAQKEAGTPVQIAYQLATPEVYATDPVDFDNTAGPLTVMTGGEVEVTLTHRMLTPYTAWTIQYDSEGEYTGDFFNVEDYDRIKQNIEYLREYAYFLYGGFTMRGMVAVTVENYGYASTIDALDANLEAIAANTFRPPDMMPVKQWRGNQPPPGADDWNRIENTCLLLFEQFERQFACLPKLAFELKGSAF